MYEAQSDTIPTHQPAYRTEKTSLQDVVDALLKAYEGIRYDPLSKTLFENQREDLASCVVLDDTKHHTLSDDTFVRIYRTKKTVPALPREREVSIDQALKKSLGYGIAMILFVGTCFVHLQSMRSFLSESVWLVRARAYVRKHNPQQQEEEEEAIKKPLETVSKPKEEPVTHTENKTPQKKMRVCRTVCTLIIYGKS